MQRVQAATSLHPLSPQPYQGANESDHVEHSRCPTLPIRALLDEVGENSRLLGNS